MKKFISMVMAAAMVVSLVPATAFAADAATFKVVGAKEYTKAEGTTHKTASITGPEVQLKVTDVDTVQGSYNDKWEIVLDFDGAEAKQNLTNLTWGRGSVKGNATDATVTLKEAVEEGDTTIKLEVKEVNKDLHEDDIIVINLSALDLILTSDNTGHEAKVEVSGDFGDAEAKVFASVLDNGIKATLKKVAEVTEEETTVLERDLVIETAVGKFVNNQEFEVRVSSGFELKYASSLKGSGYTITDGDDDDELKIKYIGASNTTDKIVIDNEDIIIDAVDAKVGDVAKLTVKAVKTVGTTFKATATAVEAAKVIGSDVTIKVEADEDVPVIYSGVKVDNYGINDDSDHKTLEVTIKESAKGAFDVKKAFNLTLPEGVFVTDVDVTDNKGTYIGSTSGYAAAEDIEKAFANAYKKGEHDTFEFARKTFEATDNTAAQKAMELKFTMTLIAVPGFEGDVTLKLDGAAYENAQEVVIAKFVSPYKVEASQNDLIIDYRNTEVPTSIVVKEAEAGLWDKDNMVFEFAIDKFEDGAFENDAVYTVNSESEMEVKAAKHGLGFTVTEESDDEAAVVTISNIALYMNRNLPAGAYNLEMGTTAGYAMMTGIEGGFGGTPTGQSVTEAALFTAEAGATGNNRIVGNTTLNVKPYFVADYADWDVADATPTAGEFWPEAGTVKEGFINIITAGRDKDDASFTKKVVVPVGEAYIIAGEETVALDVPAYINANGYTMLPVRAVATALGIDNNNVLWSQAAKQVTILYGQRIITMTVGQSVVYVNGSAIPASAAVEVVEGRAFLGLRDLANALGVTTINYDAATKTATLN